jgi:tetratricopeptide (TPR) repeat protein
LPSDPAARATIAQIEQELVQARASVAAGRLQVGLAAAQAAVTRARGTGYPPLLASALAVVGEASLGLERGEAARAAYEEAILAAEAGGDDVLRFECLTAMVYVYGFQLDRGPDALPYAERAEAVATRLGPDQARAAQLARARGRADWWAGRYDDALERANAAVDIYDKIDPGGVELAKALHLLASIGDSLGVVASFEVVTEALQIMEQRLGPDHPEIGSVANSAGSMLTKLGRFDEARAMLERAARIAAATYGTESLRYAIVIGNLANIDSAQGKREDAIAKERQAFAILERVMGPEHGRTVRELMFLGDALSEGGHTAEAAELLERGVAIYRRKHGDGAVITADALMDLGEHYLRAGEPRRARDLLAESVRSFGASQAKGTLSELQARKLLADAEMALDHRATARSMYEAVLADMKSREEDPARAEIKARLKKLGGPSPP